jgi:hypothetical protein
LIIKKCHPLFFSAVVEEVAVSGKATLECKHWDNTMPDLTILHVYTVDVSELGYKSGERQDSEKMSSGSEKDTEKKPIRHDFFVYSLHAVPGRGARGKTVPSTV